MTLGNLIRERRLKKDWTQKRLATSIGLNSSQYISNIETNRLKVSVSLAKKLAKKLAINKSEILKLMVASYQKETALKLK